MVAWAPTMTTTWWHMTLTPTMTIPTVPHLASNQDDHDDAVASVATAQAEIFAILGNKIVKNLKIFVEVDYLRSRGVLCQP